MPPGHHSWKSPRHPEIARALGVLRQHLPTRSAAMAPPVRVVVGCSGGADSVALLGLLHILSRSERLALTVAHVDHGLRPESQAEAELVTSLAETLELPVRHRRLSLSAGSGLAARARLRRRAALRDVAHEVDANLIALGHTRTDQAETVLLHLTRGAGLRGLGGIRPLAPWDVASSDPPPSQGETVEARNGSWWRPLLGLSRAETRQLATRLSLPFVDDPTNDSRVAPRTLVRHEVLPRLATINPAVEEALATAAEHADRADRALAAWTSTELHKRRTDRGDYDISDVAALPSEVRRRLFRAACTHAGLIADAVPAHVVADVDAAWVQPGPARSWDLHPRSTVHVAGGRFWVICGRGVRGPNH